MRGAPSYDGDRFPGDFAASALCGLIAALTLGPLVWWLARGYLRRTYPLHPELASSAVLTGLLDGLLLALGVFVLCFAIRIWRYERRERQQSDRLLRDALREIATKDDAGQQPGSKAS